MSTKSQLSRLFSPKSVAVVGGGVWCRSVIEQLIKIGYKGTIFPVHPFKEEILGIKSFKDLEDIKNSKPNIFYPLHCDPGRTTQPEAGVFQNQLLSIKIASQVLKEKYNILVKEHPRQMDNTEYFNHFRGDKFYSIISNLESVHLLDINVDSQDAIKRSKAVITANGSIGWESLRIGKPAILFGKPWYSSCYGAIYIDNLINNIHILENVMNDQISIRNSALNLEKYIMNNLFSFIPYDRIVEFYDSTNNEKIFWEMLNT